MEISEHYKKEKITIDLVWANVFAFLIIIPILLIFGIPYYLIWAEGTFLESVRNFMDNLNPLIMVPAILLALGGIVLHELIHGLTWAFFTKKGFKSIRFGVMWKMLTPYCHCKEPLKKRQYVLGAVMPAIVLGFIPALMAIIIGNLGMLIFGMFFTLAAAGDFLIVYALRKEKPDVWVEDHPSEAGCFVYQKIN